MRVLHAITATVIFAIVLVSQSATAAGFFLMKEGDRIRVKELLAYVLFDEGTEELVLSARFEDLPEEFGWVVPLPSAPDLTREEFFLFEQLERTTTKRQYRRSPRGAHLRKHGGSEAYQRLLLDCLVGDQTLFARFDGVRRSWELMTPILEAWSGDERVPHQYAAGSSSLVAADALIEADGRQWRNLATP